MSIRTRVDRLEKGGAQGFEVVLPSELDGSGQIAALGDHVAATRFAQGPHRLEVWREDEEDLRAFQKRARARAQREWPTALVLWFGEGLI